MNVALDLGDADEVERYAAALENYTRPEPLPWADFFIARGRALSAFARGQRDETVLAQLKRVITEGERLNLTFAVPAIEACLA